MKSLCATCNDGAAIGPRADQRFQSWAARLHPAGLSQSNSSHADFGFSRGRDPGSALHCMHRMQRADACVACVAQAARYNTHAPTTTPQRTSISVPSALATARTCAKFTEAREAPFPLAFCLPLHHQIHRRCERSTKTRETVRRDLTEATVRSMLTRPGMLHSPELCEHSIAGFRRFFSTASSTRQLSS